MHTNRTCFCCGTKYNYCPTCEQDRHLETWHIMFDNENCKKIFQICTDDFLNHTTREETIRLLEDCDLSQIDKLYPATYEQIKEILASKIVADPTINKETKFVSKYKK